MPRGYHCEKCNVTVVDKSAHLRSKKHDPENYVLKPSTREPYHCEKCNVTVAIKEAHLRSKKHDPENYVPKPSTRQKPLQTDEERRASKLASHKKYNHKKGLCELCGKQIAISHKIRHKKAAYHKKFIPAKPDVNDTSSNSA